MNEEMMAGLPDQQPHPFIWEALPQAQSTKVRDHSSALAMIVGWGDLKHPVFFANVNYLRNKGLEKQAHS